LTARLYPIPFQAEYEGSIPFTRSNLRAIAAKVEFLPVCQLPVSPINLSAATGRWHDDIA